MFRIKFNQTGTILIALTKMWIKNNFLLVHIFSAFNVTDYQ